MKSRCNFLHGALGVTVAIAIGSFLASCSRVNPNAPTSAPVGSPSSSTTGTTTSLAATKSWGCVTASAGIFGSATGCDVRDATVLSQGRIAALAAPGPSASLTGSSSGSTVTLNWLAPASVDPATSYIVEAGTSSGASNVATFDTGSTATTLTVSGVPAGTYFVRVRAKNSEGSSAPSNEITLTVGGGTTTCTTAPGAPTGLTAAVSGTSLTLTWSAPAGGCPPSTYTIEAGSTSGASNLAIVSTNGTSFAPGNVPAGTYFMRVRAGNGSGLGSPSNEVIVTVGGAQPPSSSGVTGRWVGLVANGDGTTLTTNECGLEKADWQLDLVQTGSAVVGTLTQTTVVSGCGPVGEVKVAAVTGTAGSGTVSWSISPTRRANATFTATRMTGTTDFAGSFALNRQ